MPHLHDRIDFTVGALIVHGGRVLLVHHRELGWWLAPGGHVELDEDTDEALFREIAEETGMSPSDIEVVSEQPPAFPESVFATKSLLVPRWVNIHRIGNTHRHLVLIYLCRAKTADIRLAPQEHYGIRWFAADELDDSSLRTLPDIRFYGKEAIRLLT